MTERSVRARSENSKGFYRWWVAEKSRPPIAEDAHVFQLAHRAWELRREIDALDEPHEIRLVGAAWDEAATPRRTHEKDWEERLYNRIAEDGAALERRRSMGQEALPPSARAEVRAPDKSRSGSLQFVWWGWGRWKNLGRVGPFPNTPHRPDHHACIYRWRFNLGFLEIRRWA